MHVVSVFNTCTVLAADPVVTMALYCQIKAGLVCSSSDRTALSVHQRSRTRCCLLLCRMKGRVENARILAPQVRRVSRSGVGDLETPRRNLSGQCRMPAVGDMRGLSPLQSDDPCQKWGWQLQLHPWGSLLSSEQTCCSQAHRSTPRSQNLPYFLSGSENQAKWGK